MLHTFHVTKDVRTVPLIKAIFNYTSIGSTGSLRISGSWLEKENICSRVVRYQVDVVEDAGSNTLAINFDDQVRINVNNRRSL